VVARDPKLIRTRYKNMEAFVYCWTDHITNKLYVGSHKGPTDDGYVCSSIPMIKEYNTRPLDFTRQVIAEGTYKEIRLLEAKILQSANAAVNESFYNMNNGDGKFYQNGSPSPESNQKRRETLKGRIVPEEERQKMRRPKSKTENMGKGWLGKKNPDQSKRMKIRMIGNQHARKPKL